MNKEEQALLQKGRETFIRRYGRNPTKAARAPGRVNLIGDHVDYCDGFVLPVALQFSTIVIGDENNSDICKVTSLTEANEQLEVEFPRPSKINPLEPGKPSWANYIKGVVAHFPAEVRGFDAVIVSNVPMGGGLSSSAALEVSMFTFLEALTGQQVEPQKKALLCQKAEHTFAGMPCGIMDQFVSVMARKDHALLIDCRSLSPTYIPIISPDIVILVTNSNVKHQLTGSEYPQRRAQCEEAVTILKKTSMRDVTPGDLKELQRLKASELVIKRARHVISETMRTQEAARLMEKGNFAEVGELFYESHEALSKLMEVSCPEVDQLIDISRSVDGVLGARMTGGGFGGCTVSLVLKDRVEHLKKEIRFRFKGTPEFFICSPGDGAAIIPLEY